MLMMLTFLHSLSRREEEGCLGSSGVVLRHVVRLATENFLVLDGAETHVARAVPRARRPTRPLSAPLPPPPALVPSSRGVVGRR